MLFPVSIQNTVLWSSSNDQSYHCPSLHCMAAVSHQGMALFLKFACCSLAVTMRDSPRQCGVYLMQMITKAWSAALLNGLGDIISQVWIEKHSFKDVDWKRLGIFTVLVSPAAAVLQQNKNKGFLRTQPLFAALAHQQMNEQPNPWSCCYKLPTAAIP